MKEILIFLPLALLATVLPTGCQPASRPAESTQESVTPEAITDTLTLEQLPRQWWHDSIFYEIWPRSFKDSDGDGHGDFTGMTSQLDYLAELGVDGIWLTPIFEAPSYHGYDFVSFTEVEADYGTMEDFLTFLEAAHARGMRVILDLVINHISDQHPWFQKSAARVDGYEDTFLWSESLPEGWGKAWEDTPNPSAVWHWNEERGAYYYGAFGASQPDLNLENPRVIEEMNRMATFWLDLGVDGFRLDAVRYAVEESGLDGIDQADTDSTIAYWSRFAQHVKSVNPEALLVAEAWTDMANVGLYHDKGKGLDSAFDFDFGYVVLEILAGASRVADFGSLQTPSEAGGRDALWENIRHRARHAPMAYYAPFLTNHDQVRVMHVLGNDLPKAKVAASLLMTTPGSLYLYYGEEIGLSQDRVGDDTYKRAIMQWENTPTAGFNESGLFWIDDPAWTPWKSDFEPWWSGYWEALRHDGGHSVAEQMADPDSLWHHYRRLIQARKAAPELARPEALRTYRVDHDAVWLLESVSGQSRVLTVVNLDTRASATFSVPGALQGSHLDLLSGSDLPLSDSLTLAPGQAHILRIK